ncbi:MAG: PAS domain-containing sensor histidine kinase [Verrucomicrobiota bacterium]
MACEHAPMFMAVFNAHTLALESLNREGARWLNPQGKGNLEDLTLPDLVGPEWSDRLTNTILPQCRVLGKWSGQCELRDVWGSEISASIVLLHDPGTAQGTEPCFCLTAVRLCARPDDAHALQDRELLHALLETVPESIYFKDRHSRFLRVSAALARKDGCDDPAKLIGLTDFDRFTIDHAQSAYDTEQQIIRTGEPVLNLEEKETWPDGRVTWVSTSKFPLCDRDGSIVGTFGISRDITEHKQDEAARREMETKLQLAQRLEFIGRLAAGIAHEINTPTQFITDNAHFLGDAFRQLEQTIAAFRRLREEAAAHPSLATATAVTRVAEEKCETDYYLGEIPRTLAQSLEGLERVAKIVRSLKEFSHPQNANRTQADLNHAIETAVAVSRHEWKYVADVVTDLDSNLPKVPCIVDAFNQVILNLLINASHAIGTALKQTRAPKGTITIRTRQEGGHVVVEVQDTGTGIAPEHRSKIFEPFFTTKEVGKGTGQGLALVHAVIVAQHGGAVEFDTEVGRGTTFRLRLPLVVPPAPSNPAESHG